MPKNIETKVFDKTIKRTINLERFSEGERKRIFKILNNTKNSIISEIIQKDPASIGISRWRKQRLLGLFKNVNSILDKDYKSIKNTSLSKLRKIASFESKQTIKDLNEVIGVDIFNIVLTDENLRAIADNTMIDGVIIGDWWNDQKQSFKNKFRKQMFDAVETVQIGQVKGETWQELVRRVKGSQVIPGMMKKAKKSAEALVKTSIMQVANESRMSMYKANKDLIVGYEIMATLDRRTCPQCRSLDGKSWKVEEIK